MGVLYANVNGDWHPVIGTPAPTPTSAEVYVGTSDPRVLDPTSQVLLWYDVTNSVMNVWVNGAWEPLTTTTTGLGEVAIAPDAPTDPGVEIWYDTP